MKIDFTFVLCFFNLCFKLNYLIFKLRLKHKKFYKFSVNNTKNASVA